MGFSTGGYVVTLAGDCGKKTYGAFPDTPHGRHEAESIAERLVADENTQEELTHFVGQMGVVNIYHIEGTEVENIDGIWITRDDDGPAPVIDIDISRLPSE